MFVTLTIRLSSHIKFVQSTTQNCKSFILRMHETFSFVLQGEFPDKNSQEDSHIGVAPVDAFAAQNKFGNFILAVK